MARNPPQQYNVHRALDGAQIQTGLPLAAARSECARLNAEAAVVVGRTPSGTVQYQGMYLGELVRYEIRSAEGVVIA